MSRLCLIVFATVVGCSSAPETPARTDMDGGRLVDDATVRPRPDGGSAAACDGQMVDLRTDPLHCGACGTPCGVGEICSDFNCTCAIGRERCDGVCINPDRSDIHCGGCDQRCSADETCEYGECVAASACPTDCGSHRVCDRARGFCVCEEGYSDCDRNSRNGCECATGCDDDQCGACTYDQAGACGTDTGLWCANNTCAACPPNEFNCDLRGGCECEGPCDGMQCQSFCTRDDYDTNPCGCGGDPSKFCNFSRTTCRSCSSGNVNCDLIQGCECSLKDRETQRACPDGYGDCCREESGCETRLDQCPVSPCNPASRPATCN